MKLLANGCSFSRGPGSWPYFLSENVTNLAQAGAGNTYIQESTISELCQRDYDLVIIMWTAIERMDFRVADIDLFLDSAYTSMCQHKKNDWESKIIIPFNDQDLVEKDWVFGCGQINGEKAMVQSGIFSNIYRHQGEMQFVYHFLQRVLALQSFLKANQIPYVFSFFREYQDRLMLIPHLYKMLDFSRICLSDNIDRIAHANDWLDADRIHPGIRAHEAWAEVLRKFLEWK